VFDYDVDTEILIQRCPSLVLDNRQHVHCLLQLVNAVPCLELWEKEALQSLLASPNTAINLEIVKNEFSNKLVD
jgi:hypothetical protein